MTTPPRWTRPIRWATGSRRAVLVLMVTLVALLSGCSTSTQTAGTTSPPRLTTSRSAPLSGPDATRVVLRIGDRPVRVSLADNAASRQFARTPASLTLSDAWGQAKTGRLPHRLPTEGVGRVRKPVPGGIYYWPMTNSLALYYDDLDQNVPPPGLVPLGLVEAGLDTVADTDDGEVVHIGRAGALHS